MVGRLRPHDDRRSGRPRPVETTEPGTQPPTRVNGPIKLTELSSMKHASKRGALVLQPRDEQLLTLLARVRFLTSGQVQQLLFANASLSAACRRLRRLAAHGLLTSSQLPLLLGRGPLRAGTRLYSLTRAGAGVLAERSGKSISHSEPNAFAPTVQHDLIAIRMLVSVLVEARARGLTVERWCDDRELHRRLHAYRAGRRSRARMPVPDASIQLNGQTFHIEVMRAPARGGNRSIREKLIRYVRVVHSKQLQDAYVDTRVRAVLLATATDARVASLRSLVASLPRGRQLFWLGRYDRPGVLDSEWIDGTGRSCRLADAFAS